MQSPTQVSTHNKLMRNILAIVVTLALAWIIHDFAGGKRKGALKD
jgi:Na+/glutamate symporter